MTKLDRVRYSNREQAQAATIRKMVVAMAQDVRVLIIKLSDRLHNLRTVHALREEKQRRVAQETLDVYAPLAHRLGVQEIKHEFEDRCFAILYPGPNAEIQAKLAERAPEREAFIEKMVDEISGILADSGIEAEVTGRPKHQYSIYRKMREQNRPFEDIHDLIGIRIITETMRDCYAALGLIHVMGPGDRAVQGLHRHAQDQSLPVAPHHGDRARRQAARGPDPHRGDAPAGPRRGSPPTGGTRRARPAELPRMDFLAWARRRTRRSSWPTSSSTSTRTRCSSSPRRRRQPLPAGSTAIDFAYSVHTEVGHRCVGARINGRLVPLSTRLQSGDIIEVLTSKSMDAGPEPRLARFRPHRAGQVQDQAVVHQGASRSGPFRGQGGAAGPDEARGAGIPASEKETLLESITAELGQKDLEALQVAIGEGTVSTRLGRDPSHEAAQPGDGGRLLPS